MASTEEDKSAAAAEQIGSMSLGESAERKVESGTNGDAEKNGTPTKYCSWCGKESDTHKKCRNCKCVWYCDKDCQNRHWKEHKKECKRIKKELDKRGGKLDLGTELDVGPLGKVPPREECPICMRVLPIHRSLKAHSTCCGKIVCGGCDFQHQSKNREENVKRAQKKQPRVQPTCAFCREPVPDTNEEVLARQLKRVELKDPHALCNLAVNYRDGGPGVPVDQAKCIDLLRQSAGLGCQDAQYQLGSYHNSGEMGLEQNKEEVMKYWKKAAEGGHVHARHNVGILNLREGDHVAAMRHLRLSASGGYQQSMCRLINRFDDGLLHHADLAETIQAYYLARDEMKSEGRKQYIEHLKKTGKYHEEFDW